MPRKPQSGAALRTALITIAIVAIVLAFAATLLPRGFSDDLSRIGQGRAAVVLVHNKEAVYSLELMTLLNHVRRHYEDRIEFLAVDSATDTGRRFAAAHGVDDSLALLLGGDGARIAIIDNVRDENALRAIIDRHLPPTP
jgi:hypothetical protein